MSTLRNRHTIENDIKTALIKRINRRIQPQHLKVRVSKFGGAYVVNTAYDYIVCTSVDLTELASSLGVTNATAGCDVTLPTKPTAGKVYYNKKGKPCFSQEISSRKVTNATVEVAPSYSSHY